MADRWWPNIECWLSSFVIFKGIRTSNAKKPYIFVIFNGGEGGAEPTPGSAHVELLLKKAVVDSINLRFLDLQQRQISIRKMQLTGNTRDCTDSN